MNDPTHIEHWKLSGTGEDLSSIVGFRARGLFLLLSRQRSRQLQGNWQAPRTTHHATLHLPFLPFFSHHPPATSRIKATSTIRISITALSHHITSALIFLHRKANHLFESGHQHSTFQSTGSLTATSSPAEISIHDDFHHFEPLTHAVSPRGVRTRQHPTRVLRTAHWF